MFQEAIHFLSNDQLLVYAFPFFILLIIIEYYVGVRSHKEIYEKHDFLTSIGLGILSILAELIPKILFFSIFLQIYQWDLFGLNAIMTRNHWYAWIILLIIDDFSYYWFHRLNHEVRILWAGHVPHHSSQKYNFGTALRQGVGERFHKFFFYLWIPFLGFDPLMIFMMMAINLIYQYWVHTEIIEKMPEWFEAIFNTPSHHRVHHSSQYQYLDRNHGGIFIIWDKIFNTFSAEQSNLKIIYGLTHNIENLTLWRATSHEYSAIYHDIIRANNIQDKLKYIFFAPGWSHDGPDLRAKILRKNEKIQNE